MRSSLALVLVLLTAVGCSRATSPSIPPEIRAHLDRHYPGWHFATVVPSLQAQLGPEERPSWISGDFDGNGYVDWTVQITRPAEPYPEQLLLTFLAHPQGVRVYTLQSGHEHKGIYLRRGPRGAEGRDIEADTSVRYRADAIEVLYGQEAGETFLYLDGAFLSFMSGD